MEIVTEIDAIKERHSVRVYKSKQIAPDKIQLLMDKIDELNQKGDLHLQFIKEAGDTYNKLLNKAMGLGSAPSVIACVGRDADDLDERVGYYGEQLVLYAQKIGLNTCWAGIFNRKSIPADIEEGERLVISIAVGYGENSGKPHKSKRLDQVSSSESEPPYWFHYGVKMALLAPTATNQQKFEIIYKDGDAAFRDKGGIFSKVDLGIVKYHFEVGAAAAKEMQKKR